MNRGLFAVVNKTVTKEELTIYMWSGEPVAYLMNDSAGGYHVYGFNGKHLGWFVGSVVRNHRGDAAGGVTSVL